MHSDTLEHERATTINSEMSTGKGIFTRFRLLFLTRSSFLFAALMLANGIAYLYHMLMARLLVPAEYGVMVTLTSVSYLLDVIVRTVQAAVTKTVAGGEQGGEKDPQVVFVAVMRVLVLVIAVVLLGLWFIRQWVATFLNIPSTLPVMLLGVYASLHFIGPVPRGILLGLNRLTGANASIVLEPIVRMAVGVILVLIGLGASGGIAGYATGSLAAYLLAFALIRPLLTRKGATRDGTASLAGLDRYAFQVLLINVGLMFIASIDQIMVKHYFSAIEAGNYAVTFVLGRVIVMSAISLGIVLFTRSAGMQQDDPRRIVVLVKGMLMMSGISVLTVAASLLAPALIVNLIAGQQYNLAQTYIGLVGIEMTLFGLIYVQTYYQISVGKMQSIFPLALATILQVGLLIRFHASIIQVLTILILVMFFLLISITGLTWWIIKTGRRSMVLTGT